MGFFDDIGYMFSEEGKKARAEYEAKEKAEQEEAYKQIMERRRSDQKMEEYEAEVATRRNKLAQERNAWEFQNRVGQDGYDPLDEWTKLRKEGTIQVGSDLERDESTSRLGSEGLNDVRTDERLPYIDQGYVAEDADVMGNLMNLFGGGKKNKEE